MPRTRFLLLVLPLLAACNRAPESYSPPAQREATAASSAAQLGPYISMADPNADSYILAGISPAVEAGSWRWTYKRPQMRFFLREVRKLRFIMNFAIAGATFEKTGPVTLSVLVNDKPVGKRRYTVAGKHTLELPVPAELLKPEALNTVTIEPDKVYTAEKDGAQLGFILTDAGFRD